MRILFTELTRQPGICFAAVISLTLSLFAAARAEQAATNDSNLDRAKQQIENNLQSGTANQLNKNLEVIDNYYGTLNRQLNKRGNKSAASKKDNGASPKTQNNTPSAAATAQLSETKAQTKTQTKAQAKTQSSKAVLNSIEKMMQEAGISAVDDREPAPDRNAITTRNLDSIPKIQAYRDPFALTETLVGGNRSIEDSLPFSQPIKAENLPKMKLRGVIQKSDGSRMALIELDKKETYMVKEKDRIGLSALGKEVVLYIQEIHDKTVIIETGTVEEEVIIIR